MGRERLMRELAPFKSPRILDRHPMEIAMREWSDHNGGA